MPKKKPKPKGRLMRLTKDEVQVVLNYRASSALAKATDYVHACHYSSQPYVTILCEQKEYYVYQQPAGLPEGVYRADWSKEVIKNDTPLYTFDDNKVTCPACLAKIKTKVTPVST